MAAPPDAGARLVAGPGRIVDPGLQPSLPEATIVDDLSRGDRIPSDAFDCILLIQTLHLIFDVAGVVRGFEGSSRQDPATPSSLRILSMPVSSRSRRVPSVGFTILSASPVVSVARLLMARRARIPVESMNPTPARSSVTGCGNGLSRSTERWAGPVVGLMASRR